MEKNEKRIIFNLPEETTMVDVIDEILKDNGLEESDEEFFDKDIQDKEPRLIIARDAAISIFQKKIPEKKLVELLQKHLETSKETADKIVKDIKEKLIPHAKIVDLTEEKEATRKIASGSELEIDKEKIIPFAVKKVEVSDVEKNAQRIQKSKKFAREEDGESSYAKASEDKEKKVKTVIPQENQRKGPDDYRESIE